MERRDLLKALASGALAGLFANDVSSAAFEPNIRYLRPPGAKAEDEFLGACVRCGKCGEVCPNRAINFFGFQNGLGSVDTPYIVPREQACILCMKCGDVCPTGAIKPVAREYEDILANVKMGQARVNTDLCLSWQGKSCGVCYRACPLQDVAIRVGYMEQPTVTEACIGCGLCERACIQMPQAIRIVPNRNGA